MAVGGITRRTALRGAGGISVSLPVLDEMAVSSVVSEVPVWAFNVFFGLGIPAPFHGEGFAGDLEPLEPLDRKLLILRGVDTVQCVEAGINAHFDGASRSFTAEPPNAETRAGGPSNDQLLREAHYPPVQPRDVAPTVVAGTDFRRSRVSRCVHNYREEGGEQVLVCINGNCPQTCAALTELNWALGAERSWREERWQRSPAYDTTLSRTAMRAGNGS